eukprot:7787327-Alexandrium_andersonii.AAC.1
MGASGRLSFRRASTRPGPVGAAMPKRRSLRPASCIRREASDPGVLGAPPSLGRRRRRRLPSASRSASSS